jgi:hypothetical protein
MTSHTRSKFERGRLRQGVDRNQTPLVMSELWERPALQQSAAMRDSPVRQLNQHLRVAALHELRGKNLVCWCAPERCHAEVLIELANR